MPEPGTPDLDAFLGGVELGIYAAMLVLAALLVLATVRRVLSV